MFSRQKEEFYPSMKSGSDFGKAFSYMTTMDLVETDDSYKIIADVPGVDPSNLKLWVQDYTLVIDAVRTNPVDECGAAQLQKVHYQAVDHGEFKRSVHMPKNAGLDQGKAEYKLGVLSITFPKIQGVSAPEHKKLVVEVA